MLGSKQGLNVTLDSLVTGVELIAMNGEKGV